MDSKLSNEDNLSVEPLQAPELQKKQPEAVATLQTALELAQAESKKNKEALLRLHADMDNLHKRAQRDIEKAHQYGLEKFVKALLPVVDSLEQGLAADTQGEGRAKVLQEGMELTLKLTLDTLKQFQVEPVYPMHQPFDPLHHEAMVMQPSADYPPGTVVQVVQKGYTLHGRLIRPARVIVSKES